MLCLKTPDKSLLKQLKLVTMFTWIFVYGAIAVADVIIFIRIEWGFNLVV